MTRETAKLPKPVPGGHIGDCRDGRVRRQQISPHHMHIAQRYVFFRTQSEMLVAALSQAPRRRANGRGDFQDVSWPVDIFPQDRVESLHDRLMTTLRLRRFHDVFCIQASNQRLAHCLLQTVCRLRAPNQFWRLRGERSDGGMQTLEVHQSTRWRGDDLIHQAWGHIYVGPELPGAQALLQRQRNASPVHRARGALKDRLRISDLHDGIGWRELTLFTSVGVIVSQPMLELAVRRPAKRV